MKSKEEEESKKKRKFQRSRVMVGREDVVFKRGDEGCWCCMLLLFCCIVCTIKQKLKKRKFFKIIFQRSVDVCEF